MISRIHKTDASKTSLKRDFRNMRASLAALIKELDEYEDLELFVEDLKTNNFFFRNQKKNIQIRKKFRRAEQELLIRYLSLQKPIKFQN